MCKDVEVICQFKNNGGIIPLKIKLIDEEQQYQTFNIKKYKEPKVHLKTEPGYYSVSRHVPDILDYECVINVFGIEKNIILRYFLAFHKWNVIF